MLPGIEGRCRVGSAPKSRPCNPGTKGKTECVGGLDQPTGLATKRLRYCRLRLKGGGWLSLGLARNRLSPLAVLVASVCLLICSGATSQTSPLDLLSVRKESFDCMPSDDDASDLDEIRPSDHQNERTGTCFNAVRVTCT